MTEQIEERIELLIQELATKNEALSAAKARVWIELLWSECEVLHLSKNTVHRQKKEGLLYKESFL